MSRVRRPARPEPGRACEGGPAQGARSELGRAKLKRTVMSCGSSVPGATTVNTADGPEETPPRCSSFAAWVLSRVAVDRDDEERPSPRTASAAHVPGLGVRDPRLGSPEPSGSARRARRCRSRAPKAIEVPSTRRGRPPHPVDADREVLGLPVETKCSRRRDRRRGQSGRGVPGLIAAASGSRSGAQVGVRGGRRRTIDTTSRSRERAAGGSRRLRGRIAERDDLWPA